MHCDVAYNYLTARGDPLLPLRRGKAGSGDVEGTILRTRQQRVNTRRGHGTTAAPFSGAAATLFFALVSYRGEGTGNHLDLYVMEETAMEGKDGLCVSFRGWLYSLSCPTAG